MWNFSRRGAKAQRLLIHWLCAFAPLREAFSDFLHTRFLTIARLVAFTGGVTRECVIYGWWRLVFRCWGWFFGAIVLVCERFRLALSPPLKVGLSFWGRVVTFFSVSRCYGRGKKAQIIEETEKSFFTSLYLILAFFVAAPSNRSLVKRNPLENFESH